MWRALIVTCPGAALVAGHVSVAGALPVSSLTLSLRSFRVTLSPLRHDVAYDQQTLIFHSLEAGSPRSRCRQVCLARAPFQTLRWASSRGALTWGRGEGALCGLFHEDTNLIHKGCTLTTYHLSVYPLLNTITLRE